MAKVKGQWWKEHKAAEAVQKVENDVQSDVTATEQSVEQLATQAQQDYNQMSAGAKARVQDLLADIAKAEKLEIKGIRNLFAKGMSAK